jgi:hypothetical protein
LKSGDEDNSDLVDKLFSIELENEVKNTENLDEPTQISKETAFRLSCHIDN